MVEDDVPPEIQELRDELDAQMAYMRHPLFGDETIATSPNPDWIFNANLLMDWNVYTFGYKFSADTLIAGLVDNRLGADAVVYAALFLYRHYLELRLKELIASGSELLDKGLTTPSSHDLVQLWKLLRPLLDELWPNEESRENHDSIEARITEFSAIDPRSESFRYPVDKKGHASIQNMHWVNLRHVSKVVAGISVMLDGSTDAIYEYLRGKREMLADAGYHDF